MRTKIFSWKNLHQCLQEAHSHQQIHQTSGYVCSITIVGVMYSSACRIGSVPFTRQSLTTLLSLSPIWQSMRLYNHQKWLDNHKWWRDPFTIIIMIWLQTRPSCKIVVHSNNNIILYTMVIPLLYNDPIHTSRIRLCNINQFTSYSRAPDKKSRNMRKCTNEILFWRDFLQFLISTCIS